MQPDPTQAEGVRDYVYANDAPLDGTDPTGFGLCEVPLLGGVVCGSGTVLHGAWQFVSGDDLQAITDPNASFADKAFAVLDLGTNATLLIPILGEGVEGVKLSVKGLYYVGKKLVARKFTREEVTQALNKGFRKAVGYFKRGKRPDFSKITPKKLNQMKQRGWTWKDVMEAYQKGKRVPAVNRATGNPATRYIHPRTGQSVVIDDVTGEPFHFGGPGFTYGPGSGDL